LIPQTLAETIFVLAAAAKNTKNAAWSHSLSFY